METALLAFTPAQVSALTGLSERQLRRWDAMGFFAPHYAAENRRSPYSRLYSFQDVVGLRTIGILLKEHHIPLPELRKVGAWLAANHDAPWSSLRFYVVGRRIYFDDPTIGARVATRPAGQLAFPFEMQEIAQSTYREAQRVRERKADAVGRVTHQRNIVQNSPVLDGTRIPTSAIWNFHRAGYTTDEILREYPDLTETDVRAAIDFEHQRQRRAG